MRISQSLRLSICSSPTRNQLHSQYGKLLRARSRLCSSHSSHKVDPSINPSPSASNPPNDHHTLGKRLNLFSSTPYSAGSPLLHPDGSHLFLKLQSLLRAQHAAFGFREVITPTIYKKSLWEKSGHWENYRDDMFEVSGRGASGETEGKQAGEDETWGLKPMNCPGHCLLYATEKRSWRELPVRYADFSPLHRNEVSGSLSGLTRVRRFHQDDGHIFCRPDQVKDEIAATLQMVNLVYTRAFGLKPHRLLLSTRPETSFIGTQEEWAKAESQLQEALEESGLDWETNPGDGAFYGPKIDIILRDSHGKEHQTATIQLDFQLPQRFELEYQGETATEALETASPSTMQTTNPSSVTTSLTASLTSTTTQTPIMIHRAILGSLERFLALLIEYYGGKWPFWLNPRQVTILTLNTSPSVIAHAEKVASFIRGDKTRGRAHLQPLSPQQYIVDVDSSPETLGRKLVHARAKGYSVICVVGNREAEKDELAVQFVVDDGDGVDREKKRQKMEYAVRTLAELEAKQEWRKVGMHATVLRRVLEEFELQWL